VPVRAVCEGVGGGGWGVGGAHYQCAYMFSTSSTVKMEVKNVSKYPKNFCSATKQMVVKTVLKRPIKSVFKGPINPI
jgi:hypothetical protein